MKKALRRTARAPWCRRSYPLADSSRSSSRNGECGGRLPSSASARLGMRIASQVPNQFAVVLQVEHRQGLNGPQDQDLVAPEVGTQ